MRTVVVQEDLSELEVHPKGLFDELVKLASESAEQLRSQSTEFTPFLCCGEGDDTETSACFEKQGYEYRQCARCGSLIVSPRPSAEQMDWYLKESPAAQYRIDPRYVESMEQRAKELAALRADWLLELHQRFAPDTGKQLVHIETKSPYLVQYLKENGIRSFLSVNPLGLVRQSSTNNRLDRLDQVEPESAWMVAGLDVLEHQVEPRQLIRESYQALHQGGLLALTTRSGSGFDILNLWEHSTIYPLEHLNLFTVEGMKLMLKEAGFEILEISTPGQLDIQLVERVSRENRSVRLPRFTEYFLRNRDQHARRRMQQFLQENLLSSHLRLVARKS